MPTSVRLDERTESLISQLARRTGLTKSDIIRRAVLEYVSSAQRDDESKTPYEIMADLIGRVDGGPPDLSERTGEKFRELLRRRSRR